MWRCGVWAIVVLVGVPIPGWATFERIPCDAESGGVADAGTARETQFGRSFGNPAHLARALRCPLRITAARLYGMESLGWRSLWGGRRFGWGTVGAGAAQFGEAGYRELTLSASLGMARGAVAYGIRARGLVLQIGHVGTRAGGVVDLGLLARMNGRFTLGFLVSGLGPVGSGLEDTLPGPRIGLGGSMSGPGGAVAVLDVEQEPGRPRRIRFGVEVPARRGILLRAGRSTEPGELSGGLGVRVHGIGVDVAVHWHSVLGFSERVSVLLRCGASSVERR